MSININMNLKVDVSELTHIYQRIEKTMYEGVPKFIIEEFEWALNSNVPVDTGALKKSLKFYKSSNVRKIADLQMMWYGPLQRKNWIDQSVKEIDGTVVGRKAIAFGFGGV